MKINISLRFYFFPNQNDWINYTNDNSSWQGCRKRDTLSIFFNKILEYFTKNLKSLKRFLFGEYLEKFFLNHIFLKKYFAFQPQFLLLPPLLQLPLPPLSPSSIYFSQPARAPMGESTRSGILIWARTSLSPSALKLSIAYYLRKWALTS